MIAGWHYWLLTHRSVGRLVRVLGSVWCLAAVAVCTAPRASAASNGILLNWTGLRDTYGVAPGDYFLAMASIRDQLVAAGPDVGLDPASWTAWLVHAWDVMLTNVTAANILTAEAGLFVGIVTLALWLFRITVSTYWLTVVGEIARAITTGVVDVTTRLGLIALAVPVGVFAGVLTVKRGERGRGATMILLALTMPALSVAVFSDPASQMYGPDGVLAFGRRVGFSVAEAATHNGTLGGGGFDGQVDTLTASILTHTVREPLQLWNFGHVVDRVGGCGAAWSAAVEQGSSNAPVDAMRACGDRAAVAYAQHLDGSNAWAGLVLVVCSLLLGMFMVASGWAVLKVSVKAVWTTVKLLPALWIGGIPGAPQRHAREVVWLFFRHGIEVLVYVVFVSVIGLAIERLVAKPLPAQLGGDHPFAHVLMMGACCLAAVALLRHVRRDFGDRPQQRGMLGRAGDVALGMGMQAAVGGVGGAAVAGVKGLWSRRELGSASRPPWEQLESSVEPARAVHGEPRPGFSPVPGISAGGAQGPVARRATSSDGARSDGAPTVGTEVHSGVSTVATGIGPSGSISPIGHSADPPGAEPTSGGARSVHARPDLAVEHEDSPKGDSMNATPLSAAEVPPISCATTGYEEDIPPNLDLPPGDEELDQGGDVASP